LPILLPSTAGLIAPRSVKISATNHPPVLTGAKTHIRSSDLLVYIHFYAILLFLKDPFYLRTAPNYPRLVGKDHGNRCPLEYDHSRDLRRRVPPIEMEQTSFLLHILIL